MNDRLYLSSVSLRPIVLSYTCCSPLSEFLICNQHGVSGFLITIPGVSWTKFVSTAHLSYPLLTTASGLKKLNSELCGRQHPVCFLFWCFLSFESLLLFYPFLVQNLLLTINDRLMDA